MLLPIFSSSSSLRDRAEPPRVQMHQLHLSMLTRMTFATPCPPP